MLSPTKINRVRLEAAGSTSSLACFFSRVCHAYQ